MYGSIELNPPLSDEAPTNIVNLERRIATRNAKQRSADRSQLMLKTAWAWLQPSLVNRDRNLSN